ncbi:fibronectin type III domain-containing protein [Pyxidicoccus sp. 3LFB2]
MNLFSPSRLAVVLALLAVLPSVAGAAPLYVSPSGSDSNAGTSSTAPLKTIQAALDKATAGTTIHLAPGIYRERPVTKRAGTATAPITLKGPETGKARAGRYKAVLFGTSRVFNIDHSHYVLEGFTIDGQEKLINKTYPTSLSGARQFKVDNQALISDGRLIYIGSSDASRDITGVVIRDMFLNGAGGECIRMRNNADGNEVAHSVIQWCGMFAKDDGDGDPYHNGEGVYIGTSPKSTSQPMYANDHSAFNHIHDNTIHTFGSECFNVKENAHANTFARNDCRYNDEPLEFLGSLVELRGHDNVLDSNVFSGSRSYVLKLKSDSGGYDKGGNSATNNTFREAVGAFIRNDHSAAQDTFCGNTFDASAPILTGNSVGTPTAPCSGGGDTTPPTAPSGLTGTAASSSEVDLSWSASSDNVGVTSYSVFRDGTRVATVTGLSYRDGGRTPSTTYTYRVSARDAAGNESAPSPTVSVTTLATTGPALISESFDSSAGGMTVVRGGTWAVSGGRYVLSSPAAGTVAQGNGNLAVHATTVSGDFTLTTTARSTGTSGTFDDFSVVFGYVDTANYYFASFNEGNDANTHGLFRVQAGAITQIADFTSVISTGVDYSIQVQRTGATLRVSRDGVLAAEVTDSTFTSGKVGYGSRNDAASFDNLRVTVSSVDTTAPTAPTGLSATAASSSEVDLTWSASSDDVGVTAYVVSRGSTTVCTVASLSCSDTGLSPATTYSYTVRARDAAGNVSPASSPVSVTTPAGGGSALLADDFASYSSFPAGGWTNASGNGSWAIVTDGSAAARQQTSTSATYIVTAGQATWTDYSFSARVKTGSTSVRNGLVARYVDGNNFYFLVLHNGNVVLNKKVAGSTVTVQSAPFTASTTAFHTLSLVVQGTSLQGYVDGVLRVQGTDTGLTAGKVGFYANGVATYDDVLVTAP